MGSEDRTLASWILIAGSIGVGVWYWRLAPWQRLAELGRQAAGAVIPGAAALPAVAPVQPGVTQGYGVVPNYGPPQFNPGTSGGHAGIGP